MVSEREPFVNVSVLELYLYGSFEEHVEELGTFSIQSYSLFLDS